MISLKAFFLVMALVLFILAAISPGATRFASWGPSIGWLGLAFLTLYFLVS